MTHDLNTIIESISYWNEEFPEEALGHLIENESQATPHLIALIENTLKNYQSTPEDFVGHIYALYLLALFRSPLGLPLALQLLSLPEPYPQKLLHDFLTQSFPAVIASCYNANPEAIFAFIANPQNSNLCRTVALVSLSILYNRKSLQRAPLVAFFHPLLEEENRQFQAILAQEIAEMHLGELYEKVKALYHSNKIDAVSFPLKLFETVMQSELINPRRFFLIDDVFEELNGKEYSGA